MHILSINTTNKKEVLDITEHVAQTIKGQEGSGMCHIFIQHTTAAVTIADMDPGTDQDYLNAFEAMVPKLPYRHPHDPSHVGDHIMSAAVGVSLSVPFENGVLLLGTWQRIVLMEFDGPRQRSLAIHCSV